MKGYKIFNPDFTCLKMQFEENKIFEVPLPISICNNGLHFCQKASDCFSYYSFDPNNIICEVEALGEIKTHGDDSKACTNKLQIGKKLTWAEVLFIANEGINNTGHSNSGDSNSGDRNSGNWNSGNRNSGDRNSGDSNSGDRNSGNWNSGNWNSGNWNSGNRNSGNWNSGNRNSGDRNSGNRNSGDRNSGDSNSGDSNSGNSNSGDSNSGNWNSGNRNSGDSNSGYRNSGAFCLDSNPKLWLFDKPTDILILDWENSRAVDLMYRLLEIEIWVESYQMTDEEKLLNPKHEVTGGFLRNKSLKQAWSDMWHNLSEEDKKVFTSLPNFDANKFFKITGIKP